MVDNGVIMEVVIGGLIFLGMLFLFLIC